MPETEGWVRLSPGCVFCGKDFVPEDNYQLAVCGHRCCSKKHAKTHGNICGRDPEIGKYNELDHRNG